jgi:hypothetical protein
MERNVMKKINLFVFAVAVSVFVVAPILEASAQQKKSTYRVKKSGNETVYVFSKGV